MSGISEIKKKAKLSMDEMYDVQPVGKLDNQEETSMNIQQSGHSVVPNNRKQDIPQAINSFNQELTNSIEMQDHNFDNKQKLLSNKQRTTVPIAQYSNQKIYPYKMTFCLTENTYRAFNDLYAQRMLQGRKTEKSEMFSEAIQLLLQNEESKS